MSITKDDPEFTERLVRLIEEGKAAKAKQAAEYRRPQFPLRRVVVAVGASEPTLRNWLTRRQITLDADAERAEPKWRLFSARDALLLGFAVRLTSFGYPISRLPEALEFIAKFIDQPTHWIAANRPSILLIQADGQLAGPYFGAAIDLDTLPESFAVIRIDQVIRSVLHPLGWSITYGNADDLQKAVEDIRKAKLP